jgi:hypothetical protein
MARLARPVIGAQIDASDERRETMRFKGLLHERIV